MSFRVFLSHNAGDHVLVAELRRFAQIAGITLYTYDQDVQGGRNLLDKLNKEIAQSDVVLALLTRQGATRSAIQQEVGIALSLGKHIIPVCEQGTEESALGFLKDREWIAVDSDKPSLALDGIRQSILKLKAKDETTTLLICVALVALVVILINANARIAVPAIT
jgi:hypothetical protein